MRYIDTTKTVSAKAGVPGRVKTVTFARSLGDLSERITLDLEGIYDGYDAGDQTTLDGRSGRIADVNMNSQGIEGEPSTTVNFRDWLSNMLVKAPKKNYLFVSAPRVFWDDMKEDTDDNTILFLREGDDFGVGGWTMKDIMSDMFSKVLGLNLWYGVPNFWVQQYQVQEAVPLFQSIFSGVTALQPQVTVQGSTVYLFSQGSSNVYSGSLNLTDAETVSSQRSYVAFPAELKFTGGEGEFQENEWDGPWEGGASSARRVYFYGKYWQITSPGGWDDRWTVTSDNDQLTLVYQLYAKTPFGDVSHLAYQWTEVYKRWEPLSVNSIGDVENLQYNVYTTRPTLNVSPDRHKLESVEFVINSYKNTGVVFDRPILVRTYTERLRYLYFPKASVPAPDETLYIPSGFPRTVEYSWIAGLPGGLQNTSAEHSLDYAGVWTNKGSLEKTEHIYEDDTYGGRLQESVTQEWGLVFTDQLLRDKDGNLQRNKYVWKHGPLFYYPLKDLERTEVTNSLALPSKPLWRIRLFQKVYRELSYRHAQQVTYSSVLDPTKTLTPPNTRGQKASWNYTLYKTNASITQIPAAEVPTTWSKRRGMPIKVYRNLPGGDSDLGMASVSMGLVVDWDDAYRLADFVRDNTVQSSKQIRTTVTLKGIVTVPIGTRITGSVQDAMKDFPPVSYGDRARVEGWSHVYDGSGNATTTLVVIGYG